MRVPDPPKDSVYVLSAVPPKSSRLLQKYGLLSGVETIKHPDVLKVARPDTKQRKAFVKKVEEVIASDRPYSVMGPSVFFTPPDPDKITAKHFIKQWDLQTIRIDLSRLVEDHPETIVWGAELLPYAYAWRKMSDEEFDEEIAELGFSSWEEYRDARSRPLTLDEVYDFTQADPVELWEHYHKSDIGKKYASNVPHAFIITPMGYIPYEYIEYVDDARGNPKVQTELGVIDYEVFPIRKYNDLQKKKALGEHIRLDYEMCFERLDGLKELLSQVDYVAKVYLVEKVDNTPSGTGELLYKSMFEDIAKQYEGEAVLIVSASCDKMFDSTNYPAWSSAYRAAESSSDVTRCEFILEDYYICSECSGVYTDVDKPESDECCDTWLDEHPSSSQGYYYILIGNPLTNDQRANPSPNVMYHGSPNLFSKFEPRPHRLTGEDPVVFATPTREIALASLQPWTDAEFEQGVVGGDPPYMVEMYPNAFEDVYLGKQGYLYTLAPDSFYSTDQLTCFEKVSEIAPTVLDVEFVENILEELYASDMQMIPYEHGSAFRSNDYQMRENPEPLDCHKYARQIFAHLYRARLMHPHLFTHVEIITKPFYFVHFTNYEEIIALEGFYGRSDELIDTKRTFGELVRDGHVFAFRLNANSLRGSLQELQEMFDAAEDETQHIFDWSPIGMYGIGLVISKAEMGVDMFHPGDQEIQTIIPIACIDESEMLVVSDFFEQYGLEEAF